MKVKLVSILHWGLMLCCKWPYPFTIIDLTLPLIQSEFRVFRLLDFCCFGSRTVIAMRRQQVPPCCTSREPVFLRETAAYLID